SPMAAGRGASPLGSSGSWLLKLMNSSRLRARANCASMESRRSMTANISSAKTSAADIEQWAARIQELRDRTVAEVGRVVVGMEDVTHQFLIALVAGGHVLLEGVPGVAKTTLSKMVARVLGIQYQRLQFTPDLLPSDVTGTYIFDRKQNEFVLRKGPIFCQVLL